jgi:hypothetical protein
MISDGIIFTRNFVRIAKLVHVETKHIDKYRIISNIVHTKENMPKTAIDVAGKVWKGNVPSESAEMCYVDYIWLVLRKNILRAREVMKMFRV